MNTKTMTKVLAAFLAFILSFANVALLGMHFESKTYAAESNLEEQTSDIKNTKIKFDAYFQTEEAVHKKNLDVEGEESLYLSIKVEEGYLSKGKVKVENANFKIQNTDEELTAVQSISSEKNEIILNQINTDESVILKLPITINADSNFSVQDLTKIAAITLEGTYVNNKGKEIELTKTIEVETTIDGEVSSVLTEEITKYVSFNVNGNRGVILQTLIKSNLVDNKLPVKSSKLEIEIPNINNINPKTITLSAKSQMATNGQGVKVFGEEDYKIENRKNYINIRK